MHSKPLLAGVLGLLLVTAGCLGGVGLADGGNDAPAARTDLSSVDASANAISVSGSGSASAAPDVAVVTVSITATEKTADAARSSVADRTDAVRAALADAGISDDAVETVAYRISPQYDYSKEGRDLIGYQAVHTLRITADVDRAGEVVDLAVGNGADRVDGVAFTLSDERAAEVRAEALESAVTAAKADADAVAAAADVSVGSVRSIQTESASSPPVYYAERATADAGGSTDLSPGDVTVTVQVSIVYEIE